MPPKHSQYCRTAESTHCVLYDPRAMAYHAADVRDDPPGPHAHLPYACAGCAASRRDELDAKDHPRRRAAGKEGRS